MVAKSYNSPRHSAIQVQVKTSVIVYRGRDVKEWDARNLQGFVNLPSSVDLVLVFSSYSCQFIPIHSWFLVRRPLSITPLLSTKMFFNFFI